MSAWTAEHDAVASRDWSAVPAGDEIDAAVALMTVAGERLPFSPLCDPLAVFAFLEGLPSEEGPPAQRIRVSILGYAVARKPAYRWHCRLFGEDWHSIGMGDTPMLAICRALLDFHQPADVPGSGRRWS